MNEQTTTPAPGRFLQIAFFFLLAAAVVSGVYGMFRPFLLQILFAGVIVVFTYPTYEKLKARMKGSAGKAAATMLLILIAIVGTPGFLLFGALVSQAKQIVADVSGERFQQTLRSLEVTARLQAMADQFPGGAAVDIPTAVSGIVRKVPAIVAASGGAILGGFLDLVTGSILVLLVCFFFYTTGQRLAEALAGLIPLERRHTERIYRDIGGMVDATLKGQGLTALAQGILCGIGFFITGVPNALFWAVIGCITSLVPVVGAAVVWMGGAAYLFAVHDGVAWQPLFLVGWGVLLVGTIDNVIRPWAMKSGAQLPGAVLLLAIVAGMKQFGILGILLGPLLIVILLTIITIYNETFASPAGTNTGGDIKAA